MSHAVEIAEHWTVTVHTNAGESITLPPFKTYDEAMTFVGIMSESCPKSHFAIEGPDTYSFVF